MDYRKYSPADDRFGRAHHDDDLCGDRPGRRHALVGALLIYAAHKPDMRPLALTLAGASKLAFVALVLSHGARFLGHQAGVAAAIDLAWVGVFALYLWRGRRASWIS